MTEKESQIIVVIHGEYIPPGTHSVNLFEDHTTRRWSPHTSVLSCSGITSLRSNPTVHRSEELTIIDTGSWEGLVTTDGSHPSKVRPEESSSTRCSHTSTFPNFISQKCPGHTCSAPPVTKTHESVCIPTCQVWSFVTPLSQSR